jgi:hypothetical protein
VNSSSEIIRVPKELLDELESDSLHFWFMANRVATEMAKGTKPKPLAHVLRQEAARALIAINKWRKVRWKVEQKASAQSVHPDPDANGMPETGF